MRRGARGKHTLFSLTSPPPSPRDLQRCLKVRQVRHRAPGTASVYKMRLRADPHRSQITAALCVRQFLGIDPIQCSSAQVSRACARERKKERKHATQGRDGRTARRHHTGILRRGECDALAVAHPGESASSYLFSQSLVASRCNLHATSRPSHSRRSLPCHFLLCRVVLFCLPRPAAPPPAGPLFSRRVMR